MRKLILLATGITFILTGLAGCNAGMAESGPDLNAVKQKEASLPVDQQIAMIQNSPMTAAEKKERIDALKAKGGDPNAATNSTRPGSHP